MPYSGNWSAGISAVMNPWQVVASNIVIELLLMSACPYYYSLTPIVSFIQNKFGQCSNPHSVAWTWYVGAPVPPVFDAIYIPFA